MDSCVNPLSIGTPISTISKIWYRQALILCVNPLSIGTSISTRMPPRRENEIIKCCVNPLSIGTPISTRFKDALYLDPIVSIPYLSGHPFLQNHNKKTKTYFVCQSPIYRDTHFYDLASAVFSWIAYCVNPLSIGTPISTSL